jgi:EAL domain-containing protein (putative c-di-GMP-specific phosphodiesterase class I)
MRIKMKNWEFESPFKYLESAEKIWRLGSIFNIILKKTFEYAYKNRWNFSINLSRDDLNNWDLLSNILKINQEYPIDPSRITFEILEWEWNEWEYSIKVIEELKKLWFKIAMDDFWASNSNINRLLDLLKKRQIDYIKIDWKIIKSLVDNNKLLSEISRELLEWVIKAAHSAWIKVIAEFVENEKIAMICELLWVDFLQWYYLWKPHELKFDNFDGNDQIKH